MAKESLRELLEFYRDNVQQVQEDWNIACSRWADELGYLQMDEVRLRAKQEVEKLHPLFVKKSELLWALIPSASELSKGAPRDIDRALDFCEIDVRPFRLGYVKAELYQVLKRLDLSPKQKRRVQQLGFAYVNWPGQRREMRELGRLLVVAADEQFVDELRAIADEPSNSERQRKSQVLLDKILNSRIDLRS